MRKSLQHLLFLSLLLSLAACQSATAPVQKTNAKQAVNMQSPKQALPQPMRKSNDGIQDVVWQITTVQQKRAKFFNQMPFLTLNSAIQTVQGNTGCNAIFGHYTYNLSLQQLDLDVRAGHQSCDGALAQEAELIDALQRVKRFRLQGNAMVFLDQSGQILLQAQKK
ncbi:MULTISPECIES: META domain-containing protein [unclassified Acinetobacter]|uniref:META domain-containing protein n=1 Tax=unclassified Acinetobacter TaxID=196816 RepID=UPI00190AFE86|nr:MULTISPECIES: META domain-containing protein [unclassified Acinetobacter]MBK0062656.1 META domain-containing protein [Acinetobacter sp. S55]MBK0065767.1 META domain-containing protein [Acinetobacter sp. S54]